MKKQYLNISIAALFSVALLVGTSCSKKSSDNPAPATTNNTGGGNTSTKPAAPNTADKKTANQTEEGTLNRPLTSTPVTTSSGSVSVLDQGQQRSNMGVSATSSLDNVLGTGSGQLRTEVGKTDFGWAIADVTVDGVAYNDQEIIDNGFDAVFFFNIDSSGYYWQYQISTNEWAWGTYGVDANMSTIAFDFNDKFIANEVWEITKVTKDRFVVKGKFNIDDDVAIESVVIGLNAYDLTNPNFSGETEVVPGQGSFVGNWDRFELATNLITDPNDPRFGQIDSSYTALQEKLYINADGTYETTSTTGNDNGSWILESIPGDSSATYYLYPTYYDAESNAIITDTYIMSIEGDIMVMTNFKSSSDILYFKRIQ